LASLSDVEADVPDVSEDSDDSWALSRKTPQAKNDGRKGGHCKKSRTETEEDDKSSTRNDEQGNDNDDNNYHHHYHHNNYL
jgi:hypothetical protein